MLATCARDVPRAPAAGIRLREGEQRCSCDARTGSNVEAVTRVKGATLQLWHESKREAEGAAWRQVGEGRGACASHAAARRARLHESSGLEGARLQRACCGLRVYGAGFIAEASEFKA